MSRERRVTLGAVARGERGGTCQARLGWQLIGRDSEVRTYLAGRADGTIRTLGYDGGRRSAPVSVFVRDQPAVG